MSVILLRHAKTPGNLRGAYIGCRTDEDICENAADEPGKEFPCVKHVFVSPMKRCLQTARLIYPALEPVTVNDFRECDFGIFEGLSYSDLNGRADYQAWIDSGGELPFPGGESRAEFAARSVKAFDGVNAFKLDGDSAFIVHGGTIMAVMEAYARPAGNYFDFRAENLGGFILEKDGSWHRL